MHLLQPSKVSCSMIKLVLKSRRSPMGEICSSHTVTLLLSADLEQSGEGLHATSRWHVLQDSGAHCGRGALHLAAQHNNWGRPALSICGGVWHSQDRDHTALPRHLDRKQQHCSEHELLQQDQFV